MCFFLFAICLAFSLLTTPCFFVTLFFPSHSVSRAVVFAVCAGFAYGRLFRFPDLCGVCALLRLFFILAAFRLLLLFLRLSCTAELPRMYNSMYVFLFSVFQPVL